VYRIQRMQLASLGHRELEGLSPSLLLFLHVSGQYRYKEWNKPFTQSISQSVSTNLKYASLTISSAYSYSFKRRR
jgi:hypothetical protein